MTALTLGQRVILDDDARGRLGTIVALGYGAYEYGVRRTDALSRGFETLGYNANELRVAS